MPNVPEKQNRPPCAALWPPSSRQPWYEIFNLLLTVLLGQRLLLLRRRSIQLPRKRLVASTASFWVSSHSLWVGGHVCQAVQAFQVSKDLQTMYTDVPRCPERAHLRGLSRVRPDHFLKAVLAATFHGCHVVWLLRIHAVESLEAVLN